MLYYAPDPCAACAELQEGIGGHLWNGIIWNIERQGASADAEAKTLSLALTTPPANTKTGHKQRLHPPLSSAHSGGKSRPAPRIITLFAQKK